MTFDLEAEINCTKRLRCDVENRYHCLPQAPYHQHKDIYYARSPRPRDARIRSWKAFATTGTPTMWLWYSFRAACTIAPKNTLNNVGESTDPCFSPVSRKNGSEYSPLSRTRACAPSWNDCITLTIIAGTPYRLSSSW